MKAIKFLAFVAGVALLGSACSSPSPPSEIEACNAEVEVRLDCDLSPPEEEGSRSPLVLETQEDFDALCEQDCGYAEWITINVQDGIQVLEGPDILREVGRLVIRPNREDTEVIRGFHGIEKLDRLEIGGTGSLLPKVVRIEILDQVESIEILNLFSLSGVEEIPLPKNLRFVTGPEQQSELNIYRANLIENLAPLSQLEIISALVLRSNDSLKTLEGIEHIEEMDGLTIDGNPELYTLEHLYSLRRLNRLSIDESPKIRRCDVDALLEQLEEQPIIGRLEGLSEDPCE